MDLTELLNTSSISISRISINMLLNSEPEYGYGYRQLKIPDAPSSNPKSPPNPTKRRRLNNCATSPVCVQSCPPSPVIENLVDFPISPSRFSTSSSESYQHARSRIVGLRHRGNEIIRKKQLEMDISAYKTENDILMRHIRIEEENARLSSTEYNLSNVVTAMDNLTLSNPSSRILGISEISGESAILLLELIALRRNLVQFQQYPSNSPNSVLNCPEFAEIQHAVRCRIWNSKFIRIHARWAQHEPNSMLGEEKEETAKICMRCRKVRKAGNNHPRSSCDDGFKVGSNIPYRDKSFSMLNITFNN